LIILKITLVLLRVLNKLSLLTCGTVVDVFILGYFLDGGGAAYKKRRWRISPSVISSSDDHDIPISSAR
jgi:hypothetical protein